MPITLGLNLSSLRAQSQLGRSSSQLSSVFERLSSGQRINRASDDAAGLAIAESLNSDARVFTQGIRNLNDGLSVLNIADGALNELTNITIRLAELAEQAANGTLGTQQRAALDEEAQALSDEYFRIVQSTEFNDRQLFTADFGELRLQAGYGLDASIGQGLGGAIGTGTFENQIVSSSASAVYDSSTGDFNGDGILDLVTANATADTFSVLLGDGNGSFELISTTAVGDNPSAIESEDFNGDGVLDIVVLNRDDDTASILFGNGDGTFQAAVNYATGDTPTSIAVSDFNGDGIADFATTDRADQAVSVFINNGNGTFAAANAFGAGSSAETITFGDFNGDGITDLITANGSGASITLLEGNGDGTFAAPIQTLFGSVPIDIASGDFDNDGVLDLIVTSQLDSAVNILLGNGDGTFGVRTPFVTGSDFDTLEVGDFNGDNNLDFVTTNFNDSTVSVFIGDGAGSFNKSVDLDTGLGVFSATLGDFNNDGVVDIVSSAIVESAVRVFTGATTDGVSPLLDFSLISIADAKQALSQFSDKLDQLTSQRGQIGAFQARLQVAENVLQVTTENYRAAESRIRDADIAQEAADLVRLQILQQAGASVLGQANLQPQLVLQLLGS